jgi:hypothetical protein
LGTRAFRLRWVTLVSAGGAGMPTGGGWAVRVVVRMAALGGGQSCLLDVREMGMVQQLVQGGLSGAGGGLVIGRQRGREFRHDVPVERGRGVTAVAGE